MSESNPDDFLDWLCWMWATDGQRFHPPRETAWGCIESVMDGYTEYYEDDETLTLRLLEAYQWEVGQHARALNEARMKFRDASRRGFNPVERAAREHRDLMEQSDNVDPIDWSWYTWGQHDE